MVIYMLLFLKAFIAGMAVAAPIGPVGLLCLQRSLLSRHSGLISGLGAAIADTLCALVAVIGFSWISRWTLEHEILMQWVGGAILVLVGLHELRSPPSLRDAEPSQGTLMGDCLSAHLMTALNPGTSLGFMAAFAVLGVAIPEDDSMIWLSVVACGVFLGSFFWWGAMAWGAWSMGKRLSQEHIHRFHRFASIIILTVGFGLMIASMF